jgi:DNA excision repair protein ERCC-6
MGGVDRMDENIENYRVSIRSKKWWWPLFCFCLDTCVHNAWQLFRKNNKDLDYLGFRRQVVQVYLKKYGRPSAGTGRPKSSKDLLLRIPSEIRYDRTDHWIVNAAKQNRCALCKKNSTKCCEKCNINLHDVCFKTYHVK